MAVKYLPLFPNSKFTPKDERGRRSISTTSTISTPTKKKQPKKTETTKK